MFTHLLAVFFNYSKVTLRIQKVGTVNTIFNQRLYTEFRQIMHCLVKGNHLSKQAFE